MAGLGNTFVGVQGLSHTTYGVYGQSDSAAGVRGEIPPTSSANAIAIFGVNNSSFAGGGPGGGGFGLYGVSAKGHGLVGAAATAGAAAVVGATSGVAGAYAAAFYGPVLVGGNFTVIGGAKSAAVPHPDGTLRRLYCLESPESWFEDFGRANLECGAADVGLDPSFAALVDTSDYHVFLTAHGADLLLHVADRTERGFTVLADAEFARMKGRRAGDLSGSFSWRIVARRKTSPANGCPWSRFHRNHSYRRSTIRRRRKNQRGRVEAKGEGPLALRPSFFSGFCATVAADVDLAGDDSPLGNDQAGGSDIADDGAGRVQVDPLRGRDVSGHLTADHNGTGGEVRLDRRASADNQSVIADRDLALHFAVDPEILCARYLAFDDDSLPDPCGRAPLVGRRP